MYSASSPLWGPSSCILSTTVYSYVSSGIGCTILTVYSVLQMTTLQILKELEKAEKPSKCARVWDFTPSKLYSFAGKSGQSPFGCIDSCAIRHKAKKIIGDDVILKDFTRSDPSLAAGECHINTANISFGVLLESVKSPLRLVHLKSI